jgi:hypothetical protein
LVRVHQRHAFANARLIRTIARPHRGQSTRAKRAKFHARVVGRRRGRRRRRRRRRRRTFLNNLNAPKKFGNVQLSYMTTLGT